MLYPITYLLECHRVSGIAYGGFCQLRLEELKFLDKLKSVCFAYPPLPSVGSPPNADRRPPPIGDQQGGSTMIMTERPARPLVLGDPRVRALLS